MFRFNLFGYPVTVEPWFWLTTALLGLPKTGGGAGLSLLVIWIAISFVSILWHELGHSILQKSFGGRNMSIRLHAFGGYAECDGQFTRKESILISLAGPGFQLLLAAAFWLALHYGFSGENPPSEWVGYILRTVISVNVIWALFNLLPILPLDGGRVLDAATDRPRAWVHRVSFVVAIIAGFAFFVWFESIFSLVFLGFMAYQNYVAMQQSVGGWSPSALGSPELPSYRASRPKPEATAKYKAKLVPRVELGSEHPAVVEIDFLLDKISREGVGSLTEAERRALDKASADLKAKDQRK